MTDTFVPAKAPGFPAKKTTNFRVRKADLGDGNTQVAQDGVNAAWVSYDLVWPVLSVTDANSIEAALVAFGGWQSFTYTVPGDSQRHYRASNVVKTYESSGVMASVSATFTEDPTL